MTYSSIISCFPQLKPEAAPKAPTLSSTDEYTSLGIPVGWVAPIEVHKIPGKLHQEMMGFSKKNKLEIETVTMEQVVTWVA